MNIDRLFRTITSPFRALPDTIIIGAQKAGTSSLYEYLIQHSQFKPCSHKELHYFSSGLNEQVDTYQKGLKWYQSHFPFKTCLKSGQSTLEATPFYLFHPLAAERISQQLPNVKLLLLLRDPTERAISHYFHSQRHRLEPLKLLEALQSEEQRLFNIKETQLYKSTSFRAHSYKQRGHYAEQISRFYRFFDKQQLCILDSEGFYKNPKLYTAKALSFLGKDPAEVNNIHFKSHNVATNKKVVAQEVYHYLSDYFKPHNQALFNLIGQTFDWR